MGTLSVDRIHGHIALCEDENRNIVEIPLQKLPRGVREGSVLRVLDGAYVLDAEEEAKRRRKNHALFDSLLEDCDT